jgi:hypothetical protein
MVEQAAQSERITASPAFDFKAAVILYSPARQR